MWAGLVGRSGRKRKPGKRHPSGELVKGAKPDDRIRTSRQPHRRGLPHSDRLSEKAESPFGRLYLRGVLGIGPNPGEAFERAEARYEAGRRYAVIVGEFRAIIGAPNSTSGSGRSVECGAIAREETATCLAESCRCRVRESRYREAYEALWLRGQREAKAVSRVAVHGEEPSVQDLVHLLNGLDALVQHFGLTTKQGRRHSGNAH